MTIKPRNLITALLAGVLLCRPALAIEEQPLEDEALPLDALSSFSEVFARIKSDYVEEVDDRTLLEYAIRGMLSGLDPHSAYLDNDSYRNLREGTSGEFGGLGIEVGLVQGAIQVIAPIDETPAERAGIRAGDIIVKIDGQTTRDMTLDDAVKVMRGKPGTAIILTLRRENVQELITLEIVRDVIRVRNVRLVQLDPGYVSLRIAHFGDRTPLELLRAVESAKRKNDNALRGVVLDLRNNPGGVLGAAVSVADLFLEEGNIVYTEGRVADSNLKFDAKPSDVLNGLPMVVLVNAGSASASEIVAGALQDHQRAVVMGEPTFGKGSVQTILNMRDERTALKLTTARYYTPLGRSIQAAGIVPDIIVKDYEVQAARPDERLKESDLRGHLQGDAQRPAVQAEPLPGLAANDYQLYEALSLLKGVSVLQRVRQPAADDGMGGNGS